MRVTVNRAKRWTRAEGGFYFLEELDVMGVFKERVTVRGVLSIVEWPEDCPPEQRDAETRFLVPPGHNLIVNTGKEALAQLQRLTAAALAVSGVKDLGYLAVGHGALAPLPTTTALTSESTGPNPPAAPPASGVVRPLLSVTAPPPGPPFTSNLWTAQIGSAQLNSAPYNVFSEAALFCLDDATMFAARGGFSQAKTPGFASEFRWVNAF